MNGMITTCSDVIISKYVYSKNAKKMQSLSTKIKAPQYFSECLNRKANSPSGRIRCKISPGKTGLNVLSKCMEVCATIISC